MRAFEDRGAADLDTPADPVTLGLSLGQAGRDDEVGPEPARVHAGDEVAEPGQRGVGDQVDGGVVEMRDGLLVSEADVVTAKCFLE